MQPTVHLRISIKLRLQLSRHGNRKLHSLCTRKHSQTQSSSALTHCEDPLTKVSGWYGRKIKSLLTITCIGNPGRIVSVG